MSISAPAPARGLSIGAASRTIQGFFQRGKWISLLLAVTLNLNPGPALANGSAAIDPALARTTVTELAGRLSVGDVVFIRVPVLPFEKVASATMSWTNHVGVVIDVAGNEALIGESTFPRSKTTPLSRFVSRSARGRVAVSRLDTPLTAQQQIAVSNAARQRLGVFYDTGFDLNSRRQFCSRYVREVLADATGIELGEVENFATLLARNPKVDIGFWRLWYFGNIPWQRRTVTPASLLHSSRLLPVFDGYATGTADTAARRAAEPTGMPKPALATS